MSSDEVSLQKFKILAILYKVFIIIRQVGYACDPGARRVAKANPLRPKITRTDVCGEMLTNAHRAVTKNSYRTYV